MMQKLGLLPNGAKICVEAEEELDIIEMSKIDIELIKTGKFTFKPEYLKDKYGSDAVEVNDPASVQNVKNRLDNLYK
jgi:hypothetical protein